MNKADLVELLNQPPLPASADHSRVVARLNLQQKATRYLLESLASQAAAIIDIRNKMVDHKAAIEGIGDMVTGEESEEPSILMPHKGLVGFDN